MAAPKKKRYVSLVLTHLSRSRRQRQYASYASRGFVGVIAQPRRNWGGVGTLARGVNFILNSRTPLVALPPVTAALGLRVLQTFQLSYQLTSALWVSTRVVERGAPVLPVELNSTRIVMVRAVLADSRVGVAVVTQRA